MTWVRFPARAEISHRVQTDSGASYLGCPLGVKRAKCEVDRISPSSAEFKDVWRYISTPQTFSRRRGKFALLVVQAVTVL
jgi:hypothetical protein